MADPARGVKGTTLAAAALTLAATSANAQPHHRDHRPLKIVIETVDHQRYPTGGRLAAQTRWFAYPRIAEERPALRVPCQHARSDRGLSVHTGRHLASRR